MKTTAYMLGAILMMVAGYALLATSMTKTEIAECLTWSEESKTLPDYHLAKWQEKQCAAHNIAMQAPREYCLADIYPTGEDFQIVETGAGEYDYQIIATTRGVEVWRKCDN